MRKKALELRLWTKTDFPEAARALADRLVAEVGRLDLVSYDPEIATDVLNAALEFLDKSGPGEKTLPTFEEKRREILGLLTWKNPAVLLKPEGGKGP
ncbi:MAG: hypothetical protein LBF41_05005 [Deltaproteobacteria bacterium]|nr:hypothetical protein [Deltaproteobacteria bacterium]